jgi:hypothetical protein
VSMVIGIDPGPYSCKTLKVSFSLPHPMSLSQTSVRTAFIVFPLPRLITCLTSVRAANRCMSTHSVRNFKIACGRTRLRRRSGAAAGQGRVSVDHINRFHAVQLPYSPEETGVEWLPRT